MINWNAIGTVVPLQLQGASGGGGGGGPVIGPGGGSTDNAVVRWDGVTGTLVKDSTITLSNGGVFSGTTVTPDVGLTGFDVLLGTGGSIQVTGGQGSAAPF